MPRLRSHHSTNHLCRSIFFLLFFSKYSFEYKTFIKQQLCTSKIRGFAYHNSRISMSILAKSKQSIYRCFNMLISIYLSFCSFQSIYLSMLISICSNLSIYWCLNMLISIFSEAAVVLWFSTIFCFYSLQWIN